MIWAGWLALALGCLLAAAPRPASGRAHALAETGRLTPRRRDPRRHPRWAPALAVGAAAGLTAGYLAGGPFLAVAAAALALLAARLAADRVASRTAAARQRDLLAAVRVLVGDLQAGATPGGALRSAAAVAGAHAEPFSAAAEAADRGAGAGAVLIAAPASGVRAIGSAWELGERTGAPLAGVLSRVAADLAAAEDQRRIVASVLAGARSSAGLLAGLPVLGIALGAAMGARPLPYLLTDRYGRALCCAGVVLDVVGMLWMQRILHRAQRQ